MKSLSLYVLLTAAVLLSSCTYRTSTQGLHCRISHTWKGNELVVAAHVRNDSRTPVTLIKHHDFSNVWIRAKNQKPEQLLHYLLVTWAPVETSDLETLRPGQEIECSHSYMKVESSGRGEWLVSDPIKAFTTEDSVLLASFEHNWNPDYLAWHKRIGHLNILKGKLRSSGEIKLDERRR